MTRLIYEDLLVTRLANLLILKNLRELSLRREPSKEFLHYVYDTFTNALIK